MTCVIIIICETGVAICKKTITNCDGHNEVASKLGKKCKTLRVYEISTLFDFAKKKFIVEMVNANQKNFYLQLQSAS